MRRAIPVSAVSILLSIISSAAAALDCDPSFDSGRHGFLSSGFLGEGVVEKVERLQSSHPWPTIRMSVKVTEPVKGVLPGEVLVYERPALGNWPVPGWSVRLDGHWHRANPVPAGPCPRLELGEDDSHQRHVTAFLEKKRKLEEAVSHSPSPNNLDSLSTFLLTNGDPKLALQSLGRASVLDPGKDRSFEMGQAYLGLGLSARAEEVLAAASKKDARATLLLAEARRRQRPDPRAWFCNKSIPKVHVDMSGSDLSGRDLTAVVVRKANLTSLVANHSELTNADFQCSTLAKSSLVEANLEGAYLIEVDLSEADLSQANLSESALRGANLAGANLSGADLRGADLRWANLAGANLNGAIVSGAIIDCKTRFPAEVDTTDVVRRDVVRCEAGNARP